MPFEGNSLSPEVRVLDALLAFFADEDRWLRDAYSDGQGRACLVGALLSTRRRLDIWRDGTRAYLARAIREHHPGGGLIEFNDEHCSGIDELRDTIRLARLLAVDYAVDGLPHPPSRPTHYMAANAGVTFSRDLDASERHKSSAAARQLCLAP